jgi:hypothetical protein
MKYSPSVMRAAPADKVTVRGGSRDGVAAEPRSTSLDTTNTSSQINGNRPPGQDAAKTKCYAYAHSFLIFSPGIQAPHACRTNIITRIITTTANTDLQRKFTTNGGSGSLWS